MTMTVSSDARLRPWADNLIDLLQQRASELAAEPAFVFLREDGTSSQMTYGELDRRARTVAAHIEQYAKPGERALLVYPPGLEFIEGFFGCVYAGVLAVPATYPKPRRPLPRLQAIERDCAATLALTATQTLDTLEIARAAPELSPLRWIATDALPDAPASWQKPSLAPSDLCFLQYTSGSTSDPKGVMVSHGNLLHNLELICRGFDLHSENGGPKRGVGAFWLPAYHDMGLIGGILEPLYVGGQSVLMAPTSFLQRPFRWLKAMSDYCGQVAGAPNFAYELCAKKITAEEKEQLDLRHWQVAFCGAEPIRAETLEHFAAAFESCGFRAECFYPCYGLAEATLLVSGGGGPSRPRVRTVSRAALAAHRLAEANGHPGGLQQLVASGGPLFDQTVAIVEPASRRRLGEGEVGEIWISGPSVTSGYWNRPEETAASFGATLDSGAGPFLRTGDLGVLSDGHLYVTGRVKDVIIIRGRNLYPQDIELTVEHAHPIVDTGAAFTIEAEGQERLVVVHEVDRQHRSAEFAPVFAAIRKALAEDHEVDVHAIVLIRQASLPRTTSGKVQRSLCREQYLAGELKVLGDWTRAPAHPEPFATRSVDAAHDAAHAPPAKRPSPPKEAVARGTAEAPLSVDEVDRLSERVETWLMDWLVQRAGVQRGDIARDKPFAEYGLDSLTAVELSQELEDWLQVRLTAVIAWNYPTPLALARYLAEEVGGVRAAREAAADLAAAQPADDESDEQLAALLDGLEELSDEEAEALLGR